MLWRRRKEICALLGKALNEALKRGGGREDTFLQGSVRADRTQIEAFWRSCQSGSGIE